jgi:hypothetical protein
MVPRVPWGLYPTVLFHLVTFPPPSTELSRPHSGTHTWALYPTSTFFCPLLELVSSIILVPRHFFNHFVNIY